MKGLGSKKERDKEFRESFAEEVRNDPVSDVVAPNDASYRFALIYFFRTVE